MTDKISLYLEVVRRVLEASASGDPSAILKTAVRELGAALATQRCYVQQIGADGLLVLTHEYTEQTVPLLGKGTPLEMPEVYLSRLNGQTVVANDVEHDSRFEKASEQQIFQQASVKAAIAVPIKSKDSIIGFLGLHDGNAERVWQSEEIELAETVAQQVSVALQSCRLVREQERLANSLAAMNEDLSQLYVRLASKDEQIARFMQLISHDLRAPLVGIQGLVEILQKTADNEADGTSRQKCLESIKRSTDQAANLTTALLDFVRLGQKRMEVVDVDSDELVKEIWQRLSIAAPDSELEIFGVLPRVKADRSKLEQIFQNLLENAIKYRKEDTVAHIDVTCHETEKEWQFAVNDDGMGFPPSEAESLFDLFSRLKEASSKPGTGIGLASVMELARMHGGNAWAIGRPGKGSTFYFSISKSI